MTEITVLELNFTGLYEIAQNFKNRNRKNTKYFKNWQ